MLNILLLATAIYCTREVEACNGCTIDQSKFKVTSCSDTTDELYHWPEKKPLSIDGDCKVTIAGNKYFKIDIESFEISIQGEYNGVDFSYKNKDGCSALSELYAGDENGFGSIYHFSDAGLKCPIKSNEVSEDRVQMLSKEHIMKLSKYEGFTNVTLRMSNINGDPNKTICHIIENQMDCQKTHRKG